MTEQNSGNYSLDKCIYHSFTSDGGQVCNAPHADRVNVAFGRHDACAYTEYTNERCYAKRGAVIEVYDNLVFLSGDIMFAPKQRVFAHEYNNK